MVERQEKEMGNGEHMEIESSLKPVKNPISPYMMFVSSWKTNHPGEKFNMSSMGEIWKSMGLAEKEPFETEYKEKRKQYLLQHLGMKNTRLPFN
jgi:hypothetical protein